MSMDHVVFLDFKSKELENLIKGLKSMIIRGTAAIQLPRGGVNEGDVLYFINNNGEREVRTFELNFVLRSDSSTKYG